ncbi:MAG: patatin-like phospholipase family protein, partial [Thermoanaerobaculia bacterium]
MPSLPREVHEVLEHEYVSMYGPLPRVETAYTAEQVLDLELAVHLFRECGVLDEGLTAAGVAAKLNEFLAKLPPRLIDSPALSNNGRLLLERYAEFAEIAKAEDSLRELHRRIVDDALSGAVQPLSNLRLANVYDALHQRAKDPAKARTALCISGGGIRSATFALGVIQGLASAKVLDKFDYLSTVSGGGYIGSWLSSWARRHPQGISGVQKDLADADTASGGRPQRAQKIEPEPEPLRHLRDYSNYRSPRMGLLSGDSWTMGALYSRNLLLNLLVFVPVLAAVLTVPRAYAWAQRATLFLTEWTYPVGTVLFIAIAFAFIGQNRPVDYEDPRQQRTTDGSFILWC